MPTVLEICDCEILWMVLLLFWYVWLFVLFHWMVGYFGCLIRKNPIGWFTAEV